METIKVLWLGVTPLERGSERCYSLAHYLGRYSVSFPNTTSGMEDYEFYKSILKDWEVFATDEENIDESWEHFFCADNWGKKIVQFKDGAWRDVNPGFSKEQKITDEQATAVNEKVNVKTMLDEYYNKNPK